MKEKKSKHNKDSNKNKTKNNKYMTNREKDEKKLLDDDTIVMDIVNSDNENINESNLSDSEDFNVNKIENDDEMFTKIYRNSDFNTNSDEEKKMSEKQSKKESKKDKKKKKKFRKLRLFLKIIFFLILVLIVAGVAAVVAIFKTDRWAITEEQLLADAGATIYDGEGNLINTLTGDEINKKVAIGEMGKLPDAFVAIEDERFYEHNGIDIKRTAHAILDYVLSLGKGSFGGSTITQQLIKITMKDDERGGLAGIERKIREWSRAVQVEKMINDKDKILERYLNRIYLGSSNGLEVKGVESASNYYFNKSAKDLSLAQTAFLAGINHAPNSYNPFGDTDKSEDIKTRTLNVLAKMKELGKITEEEYTSAVEETKNGLAFEKGQVSNGNSDISFHTAAAINQIARELSDEKDISYDAARDMLINSGYSIYTTVHQGIQDIMEEEYMQSKYIKKGADNKKLGKSEPGQSAMVVVEPSTGYVVGEVGSLEANPDTLGLNRGLSARQGGSAFKPLVTIAPGLENKVITAATLFNDTPTSFGKYNPHNDSSYGGITSIRNAITQSYNVTEVKLLSIMGVGKSAEFLGKIGINVDADNAGLSMALGSVSVTPVQMATGYAMIANGGVYITPTFYTKVVDRYGETVIEAKQEKTRVMSEDNAYIESTILRGPVQSGTASSYSGWLGAMDVGGKTGTSDSAVDRWFCGITPYYAAACWYGADDGYNIDGNGTKMCYGGSNPACAIWFPVMKRVHKDLTAKKFVQPSTIKTVSICKATGKKATESCTDTYSEIFSSDNIPDECDGHSTVKICKESGKLATEFCTDTEDKVFGVLIDTEKIGNWSPKQKVEEAPEETCDLHKEAEKIDVPNVVGKTEKKAKEELEKAGFKVKVLKDNDKKKEKGIVLKQSATKASKGAEISITVNQYEGGSSTNTVVNETTTKNETVENTTVDKPSIKNETEEKKNTTVEENVVD